MILRLVFLGILAWTSNCYTYNSYPGPADLYYAADASDNNFPTLSDPYNNVLRQLFEDAEQENVNVDEELKNRAEPAPVADQQVQEKELRIPGELPPQNDSYLCTAFEHDEPASIVSFEPLDYSHAAHHIILFVCDQPGTERMVGTWDCGEMAGTKISPFERAPPCRSTSAPIFAWSHNAGSEKTELPAGVGFHVGGRSASRFLILQVHYMKMLEKPDFSGVKIGYTDELQPKTAATLLLVTGGKVGPQTRESFEAACIIDENIRLHPISFRVHTHSHGEKVSGWVVKEDEAGEDTWSLLGERSPQEAQIFTPVRNASIVIEKGDVLAAKCIINNDENRSIAIGSTSADEMCNFYLMYYSDGRVLSDNVCYSPGAPDYHWSRNTGFDHIPN